jgi:hypothetical protein
MKKEQIAIWFQQEAENLSADLVADRAATS